MAFLEIKNLEKAFGGVHAVRGASLHARAGEVTALVGPNGAGKTTVFNLVSGVHAPDAGSILLRGSQLVGLPAWKRSRLGLARTFQLSRLFRNLSIEENLLIAHRQDDGRLWGMFRRGPGVGKEERAAVHEMLGFVGLEKDPAGSVEDLSYGQQKLFDLARALLSPHQLLMLDEPVAGVNPVLRDRLKGIVRSLRGKGETVFLIEHDMDFVRSVADHVVVMAEGKVIAEGEPNAVLSDSLVLEAYLGNAR